MMTPEETKVDSGETKCPAAGMKYPAAGAAIHHVPMLYGEPMPEMPRDLYIPPDALEIILDAFEGPLDLLLYLIRKANLSILDIPMAPRSEERRVGKEC